MICSKCNHKLPDDSEFCQYCGCKIVPAEDCVSDAQNTDAISDVPEVPVSLQTEETTSEKFPKEITTEEHSKLSMQRNEAVVPVAPNVTKEKKKKRRYCSRCGSLIDNQTKQCTGCGKKYFKGIRFNKIFFIVLSFSLVLLAAIGFIIYQYNEINALEKKTSSLQSQITTLKSQKTSLEKKVDDLKDEKWDNYFELNFFQDHAVIVDKHSKKYHEYDCSDLDLSYFWIYNTEKAEQLGYYACSKCH